MNKENINASLSKYLNILNNNVYLCDYNDKKTYN